MAYRPNMASVTVTCAKCGKQVAQSKMKIHLVECKGVAK